MVRFDFLGTTRGGDARSFVDDKLKEELKCFRCIDLECVGYGDSTITYR
jgi:hypothetical protein